MSLVNINIQRTGPKILEDSMGCFPPLILALLLKELPSQTIILNPDAQRPRRLIGDRALHRSAGEGVIQDRAADVAGLHVLDVLPPGGLVSATT